MSKGVFVPVKNVDLAAMGELDKFAIDDKQFFAFFAPNPEINALKNAIKAENSKNKSN